MEPVMEWGLEVIRAVQAVRSPALDIVFRAITSLGGQEFYFLLLPLLLWCIDYAVGVRLGTAFLLATYVNIGLKDLFALPRPFSADPSVRVYDAEGYGLPSGHAQLSVVLWGSIAHTLEKGWAWVAAVLLALLIGFSRVYLGVHFPTDVLMGWFVGALLVLAYVAIHCPTEAWLEQQALSVQLVAIILLPLALLVLNPTANVARITGIMLGIGVGVALLMRYYHYDAGGPLWQRVVRLLLGIVVLLVLRFGLSVVSPAGTPLLELALRFARYVAVGLWVGLGAPWLFNKLALARGHRDETT